MSYNDVYLGEKSLEEELMKEVKRLTYDICRTMVDPFIPAKLKNQKVSNQKTHRFTEQDTRMPTKPPKSFSY